MSNDKAGGGSGAGYGPALESAGPGSLSGPIRITGIEGGGGGNIQIAHRHTSVLAKRLGTAWPFTDETLARDALKEIERLKARISELEKDR